jgi:hypothetical protein
MEGILCAKNPKISSKNHKKLNFFIFSGFGAALLMSDWLKV